MSDDKKSYTIGGSFFSILLFLAFCNLFQPNAMLGELTIITVFWSIILSILLVLGVIGVIIVIGLIIAVLLS